MAHLEGLSVWELLPFESYFSDPAPLSVPDADLDTDRSKITTLRLFRAPLMGDYLLHPCCPFDLSQLINLELYKITATIGKALEAGRLTIKLLACSAYHLHIDADDNTLCLIAEALSSIAGNNIIATVEIGILPLADYAENWNREAWPIQEIDEVLSSAEAMPALSRVELNFEQSRLLGSEGLARLPEPAGGIFDQGQSYSFHLFQVGSMRGARRSLRLPSRQCSFQPDVEPLISMYI
ncbi:hypothetical protein C8R43DRAFT_1133203 [Mycena crocata]|nr:hypothetical protein C8R43DRAFT_1133203 [Mycena crocata]